MIGSEEEEEFIYTKSH